jgi:hypothetical protein
MLLRRRFQSIRWWRKKDRRIRERFVDGRFVPLESRGLVFINIDIKVSLVGSGGLPMHGRPLRLSIRLDGI